MENRENGPAAVLALRGVTKRFRKEGKPALDRFDLLVPPARVTGLVGPDGAGKTTLIRLAAGLLVPEEGDLSVLGLDPGEAARAIRSRIGYMPQQFGLYQDLTIQENLELYADLQSVPGSRRKDRFAQLLEMTGLAPFTGRRAGALSGGMKQKLGLACTLIKSPELLLLDEPTVGVDPVSRRDLWRIVYQLVEEDGIGVVLATTYLDEADRCHRVVVMDQGVKLEEGPPETFHRKVQGRVFAVSPSPRSGPRRIQMKVAGRAEVLDATIRSGRVRCVLRESRREILETAVPEDDRAAIEAVNPNFEDAFMAMWADRHEAFQFSSGDAQHEPSEESGPVVEVKGLTKRFGTFKAVQGIEFSVRRGEVFGLLGPNGAGKTTTFRMLCGLSAVSNGEVSVAGRDLRRAAAEARAQLGYMAQLFSLYRNLSVLTNLRFYGRAYGLRGRRLRERIDWALDEFELRERRNDDAGSLPGGFRQRLAMATAMLHEPKVLFLDEPTSGADPLARREFWLRINGFAQAGVTVIVTTHFMEEAEYCDHMIIMSRGRELAKGSPAEIRALVRSEETPDPSIEDAFVALAEKAAAKVKGGEDS